MIFNLHWSSWCVELFKEIIDCRKEKKHLLQTLLHILFGISVRERSFELLQLSFYKLKAVNNRYGFRNLTVGR